MTINLSNSLIGLSILSGSNSITLSPVHGSFVNGCAMRDLFSCAVWNAVSFICSGPRMRSLRNASTPMKANIAAARDLPRQLRLRGLGGQVIVDFAPMPKRDRAAVEQQLRAAFKGEASETSLAGWTPLGNYELQRKRDRLPLTLIVKE